MCSTVKEINTKSSLKKIMFMYIVGKGKFLGQMVRKFLSEDMKYEFKKQIKKIERLLGPISLEDWTYTNAWGRKAQHVPQLSEHQNKEMLF